MSSNPSLTAPPASAPEGRSLPPATLPGPDGEPQAPPLSRSPDGKTVIGFSNGMKLCLDLDGNEFRGIGEVSLRGKTLRSASHSWAFYTESETGGRGLRFETFTLESLEADGERAAITLRSRGRWMPRIQEADAMGEARIRAPRLAPVVATFIWRFRAITETVYETPWDGLAMRIEYRCGEAPIHWLLETATWEIDGEAGGCTLIRQDTSAMDAETTARADSAFSTIEKFHTEGWGGSFPMDMMPRAAGAAICDFQSKDDTALCLFAEQPGMTRARLEKFSDENVIHHLDRFYFPLGTEVATPERKLLVHRAQSPLARHEARNLWLDAFGEVRRRILAHYGFEPEIPVPSTGGHLWDDDLRTRMDRWPEAMENDFAQYARLGYRQIYFHGVWEGITTDPNPPEAGNICCPYTFRFAESFGGAARMRKTREAARRHGLRLMQWFSFHLSRHAPLWKTHRDWVLKEANGDPWDGNYRKLWSGRMRSGYAEAFQRQIEAVGEETGIDGIFWDSYHNLGVVAVDWSAPDKAPQADEIFRMQAELQRRGFSQWVEATTIFGISRVALFGFDDTGFRRRLWSDCVKGDHAFALIDTSPGFFSSPAKALLSRERLSPELYFWLVAHRAVPGLGSDPWQVRGERFPGGERAEAYARTNHLYNAMLPRMKRLRLQEGGTHLLWLDDEGRPAVLWVFADGVATPPGCWREAGPETVAGATLRRNHVYFAA